MLLEVMILLLEVRACDVDGGDGPGAEHDWGRMTQIRSPETIPQEARVCPVSVRDSFPFKDRWNSVSGLHKTRRTQQNRE